MLLSSIQAPLTRLAGALNAKTRDLISVLKQLGEQKGGNENGVWCYRRWVGGPFMYFNSKTDSWLQWLETLPPGFLAGALLGAGITTWGNFIIAVLLKRFLNKKEGKNG